jgi:hypothetical protein
MLTILNQGQAIRETNYLDSDHAQAGLCYLSWNAGAARLLVPDLSKHLLPWMKGGREVIVSRGPWTDQGGRDALELLWEDDTHSPPCLHLVAELTDRLIPDYQQGGGFVVTAWTRGGMEGRWPGKYRVVPQIPDLSHWSNQ